MFRRKYKECKLSDSNAISLDGFRRLFCELDMLLPGSIMAAIFQQFDTRKCEALTFRDVCLGLVTTCISSWDVRARFIFSVFDRDEDGYLNTQEAKNLILCIISSVRQSVASGDNSIMFPFMVSEEFPPAPPLLTEKDLERIQSCVTAVQSEAFSAINDDRSSLTSSCYIPTPAESQWMDYELSQLFQKEKHCIDFRNDFLPWSCRNCHYLYKFLELFEIVPSPAKEKRICLHAMRNAYPVTPGSTWYVLSYKWVQLWRSYVHWSEADSNNTVWMPSSSNGSRHGSHPIENNQVVIGEIFHAVSTMDAMSCTSTIIQQRMTERPMAINNSDLEGELKGALRTNLIEFHDYLLVPETMWRYLVEWYGGGPSFPRKISGTRRRACSTMSRSPTTRLSDTSFTIDLYPPLISVVLCGENGLPVKNFTKRFFVSKSDTCAELLDQLLRRTPTAYGEDRQARLWHKQNGSEWALVDCSETTNRIEDYVEEQSTEAGIFMLELAGKRGKWPREGLVGDDAMEQLQIGDQVDAVSLTGQWSRAVIVDVFDDRSVKVHFEGEKYIHDAWLSWDSDEIAPLGTHTGDGKLKKIFSRRSTVGGNVGREEPIGLENIGNTCFMNSSLQCLSHTPMLREYFLSKEFQKHMRSGAKMAGEFASLLCNMWSSSKRFIAPKGFKKALDKHAPLFSGYEHQDAHELLAVLLDGLHEDLNRGATFSSSTTATTTASATPEGPGTPVASTSPRDFARSVSAGEDEWRRHRVHNTSVIADLFDGQQRIVTECKSCGHQCENFEAFRYLMLPVPITDTRNIAIDLVLSGSGEIVKLTAAVHRGALMQAVITNLASRYAELGKLHGIDWENGGIVLVEIYMSRIHRFVDMSMPVSEFRSDDKLVAFQVDVPSSPFPMVTKKALNESGCENFACAYAQIVHRREVVSKRSRRTVTRKELFGIPLVVSINPNWSQEELHKVIRDRVLGGPKPSDCPFVIRLTTPDGSSSCSSCGQLTCEGCIISPNCDKILISQCTGGSPWLYLAIDWRSSSSYMERFDASVSVKSPAARPGVSTKSMKSTSLYDCMDAYTASEFLSGDNRWNCDKCKQLSDAERRTSFWVTPDVLVVLLKRFQFSPTSGFEKISVPVKFPESDLVIKSSIYDLYGVVNHYGSLSGGHYTALCREDATSRWFVYNDHQVTLVAPDQLQQELNSCARSCYVLFYKRRSTRPANIINYYGLNE